MYNVTIATWAITQTKVPAKSLLPPLPNALNNPGKQIEMVSE